MGSDESPIIYTYAGTGEGGYTGDGGPASDALMREPFMCAFDDAGNLFVCEATNHIVRRVDAQTGVITTIAGTGEPGYTGDGGPATEATMYEPYSLAIDSDGSVYIVDRLNAVVRRVDANGIITTVAGTGEPGYSGDGGPGIEAQMREPNDCFLDGKGGLLIADIQDQRIRRLDIATGVITTFAGNGEKTRAGDGLPATDAGILGARAVCMDGAGNTYIAEREGNGVRVVTPDGILSTVAGANAELGYTGDVGPALDSTWAGPKGIRCDAGGNIIVTDTENHAIRRIDAVTRIVTTIAGGQLGGHGDDGPATDAGMDRPHGCEVGPDGSIYVADSNNHRVRVFRPNV